MPIYEFECRDCRNVWDALQKFSEPDPANCPKCGKSEVQRRMTAAAFRLKGAGWYETDFKKDSDTKRNLVEAAPASESRRSGDTADNSTSGTESTSKSADAAPATTATAPASTVATSSSPAPSTPTPSAS
jgi:putative FmdB family regulatory protein